MLLISSLFIVLAARLELSALTEILRPGLLFVAILILIARPLNVFVSTWRSELTMRQRLFVASMAPRGIVAAAVASVFASGNEAAAALVPITFITIVATVAVYGLITPIIARGLGIAESNPQGVLFAGAQPWAREVAALLHGLGYRVLMVDSNRENAHAARMAGLPTHVGSILGEDTLDAIELGGIGRLLAVTPNDWVNVLAVHRFSHAFGKAGCFQLSSQRDPAKEKERQGYLRGRLLFGPAITCEALHQRFADGFTAKATRLSDEFDYAAFRERYGESAVPMFIADQSGELEVVTADEDVHPEPGQTLISFVRDKP
ncbi:MAG: cation:proton antiporter [Phycisphaerae bacterium]